MEIKLYDDFAKFIGMFEKLKKKWDVNWLQFTLIFITFALGGSLCAKIGNLILTSVISEKNLIYWIIYVPLLTILWPACVLLISIPFGQFKFFKKYLAKMGARFGIGKSE